MIQTRAPALPLLLAAAIVGGCATSTDDSIIPAKMSAKIKGPSQLIVASCSEGYGVLLASSNSDSLIASSEVSISLATSGSGKFYSDPVCQTEISTLTIEKGGAGASFYYGTLKSGSDTLTITSSSFSTIEKTITVYSEDAAQLKFTTQPASTGTATHALATAPVVSILDQYQNVVTSAQNNITLVVYEDEACTTPASGSLSGILSPTQADAGMATFTGVTYSASGTIYLGASATDLVPACSEAITVVP